MAEDPACSTEVLIGIVGYSPVVDAYPLGPKLMAALEARLADRPEIAVENMSWGPIHVVQRFQDEGAVRPRRVVLVGASALSIAPGRVQVFAWTGGSLPAADMQERIYEAVTGVVDIENMLVIGSHFEIWPDEVFSVEVDLPADTFGTMVIADSRDRAMDDGVAEMPFSPRAVIAELVETTLAFALDRPEQSAQGKSAGDCADLKPFIRNRIAVGA